MKIWERELRLRKRDESRCETSDSTEGYQVRNASGDYSVLHNAIGSAIERVDRMQPFSIDPIS